MLHAVLRGTIASFTLALIALAAASWLAAPPPVDAQAPAPGTLKYTGAASCAASNCHGSTKPRAEYPRLDENIVWTKKDKHAQGYATLLKKSKNADPAAIAKNMKIAKPEASDRCLVCHAVNVPQNLRGPKFDITEGVHCDGCHGPAEKWLEPHAEKGWTHEKSVALGMYDTKNFLLRAEKCVSCHLQIDHDMVAAGHPDLLAFELDTFSLNMPPHWRDKGTWIGTKTWAVGQVISLREAAKQVADRAKAGASVKLLEEAMTKVRGHGAVVRHLLAVRSPDAAKALPADLAALGDAVGKGDKGAAATLGTKIAGAMNQEAPRAAGPEYDQASTQKIMKGIAGDADAIAAAGIRAAEQAAMALDRLYSTYSKAPGQKADKAVGGALDRMFAALEDPAKYSAPGFAKEVKAFDQSFK
ncbi:MAG: multiheme c-type cytochrome [Candidatus Rokuibacteriota bacterium]